ADSAITQYFYNPDAYFRFIEECTAMNIKLDIVPGIMPITNYQQLARFSDTCGSEIPRWIRSRLEALSNDLESLRLFGEEVVTELCQTLIDNEVPGLHFYTLNKAEPSLAICRNLGLV
ncbi:MAG: methylenetetrahydrofolate reductase, partial [Gammaproteobacteria bacterium]|nr:methylenetetrahydrofolate reductase [Gammaproteobacteria bacterium]